MPSAKAKGRSPSYPAIDLQTALGRAQTLYEHERRNAAPVDTILQHWGYRPKSGLGLVTLAALKKFGLLIDQGQGAARTARLSDLALKIILAPEGSPDRQGGIQEAAVKPAIHHEVFDRFGFEPFSDANLKYFLRFDRKFTDNGADEFIDEYRSTMAFGGLTESANLSTNGEDSEIHEPLQSAGGGVVRAPVSTPTGRVPVTPAALPATADALAITVPLGLGKWAVVQADFPLSEAEWAQFGLVLNAMKPGLVAEPEGDPHSTLDDED